ncbi:MAG: hypothetical protein ACKO50_10710, partial [Cyanobium sp.]
MHRLAPIAGAQEPEGERLAFVEQTSAPLLLLSSADGDLRAVGRLLEADPTAFPQPLRLLNLAALGHPAVVDHFLASSLSATRLVVVRLLGGRGHWSYGLER